MKQSSEFNSSISSDTLTVRTSPAKTSKSKFRPVEQQHKQQAYGRPDDWVGPVPNGSTRKITKSWRRKESPNDLNKITNNPPSVPLDLGCIEKISTRDRKYDPVDDHTLHEDSLHSPFTFRDISVATGKECTDYSGIDESMHSVLTEDSTSKFSDVLKMWNGSSSLGPHGVHEGEDEDASLDSRSRALSLVEGYQPALPVSNMRSHRWNSRIRDTKPCAPESEVSFVSATESDNSTWKSSFTVQRDCRPSEQLPLRPTQMSRYHMGESSRSIFSDKDSISSSCSSSHFGHHGHNRPDTWVGEQYKPARRSWRPKSSISSTN
jgi:hypothetical protein